MLIFLVGSIFSVFKNSYDFAVQFLVSPSIFYIFGRTVNVLISLFTIFMVFRKMSKIFTEQIGYIAAIIFAVSYYMILASQQAVSDVWLLLFCTLSTLYFLDFIKDPEEKKYIWLLFSVALQLAPNIMLVFY